MTRQARQRAAQGKKRDARRKHVRWLNQTGQRAHRSEMSQRELRPWFAAAWQRLAKRSTTRGEDADPN